MFLLETLPRLNTGFSILPRFFPRFLGKSGLKRGHEVYLVLTSTSAPFLHLDLGGVKTPIFFSDLDLGEVKTPAEN